MAVQDQGVVNQDARPDVDTVENGAHLGQLPTGAHAGRSGEHIAELAPVGFGVGARRHLQGVPAQGFAPAARQHAHLDPAFEAGGVHQFAPAGAEVEHNRAHPPLAGGFVDQAFHGRALAETSVPHGQGVAVAGAVQAHGNVGGGAVVGCVEVTEHDIARHLRVHRRHRQFRAQGGSQSVLHQQRRHVGGQGRVGHGHGILGAAEAQRPRPHIRCGGGLGPECKVQDGLPPGLAGLIREQAGAGGVHPRRTHGEGIAHARPRPRPPGQHHVDIGVLFTLQGHPGPGLHLP